MLTRMQGRGGRMVVPVVCSYWILLWACVFNIYQHQVQHQLAALSMPKGKEDNFIEGKHHSYSKE